MMAKNIFSKGLISGVQAMMKALDVSCPTVPQPGLGEEEER